jgi:hypothetical protein
MPPQTQREGSGIDGRAIAVGGLAVLLLLAMASALVRLLSVMNGTTTSATRGSALQAPQLASPDARRELQQYQATESAWLNGYGWQGTSHAVAHIPIERAMQLLLQHPELARPTAPAAAATPATSAASSARPAPSAVGPPFPIDVPRSPDRPQPLAVPPPLPPLPPPLPPDEATP